MGKLYLNGDLNQMSDQRKFLMNQGFSIGQEDVYPTLGEVDAKAALTKLWEYKVSGWWNYHSLLLQKGICTESEFKSAL